MTEFLENKETTGITDVDWLDARVCELSKKIDTLRAACISVLCNRDGKACFQGSDGDRKIIDDALEASKP